MKLSIYLILLLFFTGCLGNYPTATSTSTNAINNSKENKVKEGVSNHVKNAYATMGAYKSIQFGEVFMLKPKEIIELDKMIEEKNQLPLQREKYGDKLESVIEEQEVKIAFKKQEIQDSHIYPWYEVNHLFAIVPAEKDSVSLYEFDFEVYPNYTIKEVGQRLAMTLTKAEFKTFEAFIKQEPIYESDNYSWAYEKNAVFYKQSVAALEEEDEYKAELLRTILKMSDYISLNNEFSESDFAKKIVKEWQQDNIEDELGKGSYSDLTPILSDVDGNDVIAGYQITHTLEENDKSYLFIFDLNFVLTSVKQF